MALFITLILWMSRAKGWPNTLGLTGMSVAKRTMPGSNGLSWGTTA